jgi:hypothetical protein
MRVEAWSFSNAQGERLMEIADRCPVHRTLTMEIVVCNDSGLMRVNQGGAA